MGGLRKFFTAMIIGAMLALPAGAMAQGSSAQGGYNQPGGVVQDQIVTQPARASSTNTPAVTTTAPPAQTNESNLPFTGLDLAFVVGAGGVLLLLGFGIRRFTRATDLA
jgi:hypothetical protein